VIATAQFLVIMDTSIIGVALPDMQEALSFSPSNLSWVFNAYVVAFGGLLLLGASCPTCSARRSSRRLVSCRGSMPRARKPPASIAGRAQGAGRR
jgi:MFS family permease